MSSPGPGLDWWEGADRDRRAPGASAPGARTSAALAADAVSGIAAGSGESPACWGPGALTRSMRRSDGVDGRDWLTQVTLTFPPRRRHGWDWAEPGREALEDGDHLSA